MPYTKPSDTPRWATDADTTVEPNSGQKDNGWEPGQEPAAEIQNWHMNLTWQWLDLLDTLIVDSNGSWETDTLGHLKAGQYVQTGEADIRHDEASGLLSAGMGTPDAAWTFSAANGIWTSDGSATSALHFPMPLLKEGDRLKDVGIWIRDASSKNMLLKVWKRNFGTGAITQLGSTDTSAGDGTDQLLEVTGIDETLTAGFEYYIEVQDEDGSTNVKCTGGFYVYDRVA